jgi:hypothetical protein
MPGPREIALAIVATIAVGCASGPRRVPLLGAGPFHLHGGLAISEILRTAELEGYHPEEIDEAHGRFRVLARSDTRGRTTFTIQCTSDGWITIRPEGPEIDHHLDTVLLPRRLAEEYVDLSVALSRGGTPPRR